jgi:hypothetical protein
VDGVLEGGGVPGVEGAGQHLLPTMDQDLQELSHITPDASGTGQHGKKCYCLFKIKMKNFDPAC